MRDLILDSDALAIELSAWAGQAPTIAPDSVARIQKRPKLMAADFVTQQTRAA